MNSNIETVNTESIPAEQTAPSEDTAFFAYDEAYAREKKTYGQHYHKVFGLIGCILAGVAVVFAGQQLIPESNLPLAIGAALWFFGIFVCPRLPSYKLSAWYRSFCIAEGKLWAFRFTPYRDRHSTVRQNMYNAACFEACTDKNTIIGLIDDYNEGAVLKKNQNYRRVSVIPMEDVKIIKPGKKTRVSYTDDKGKARKMMIADCYPGLFEAIEGMGK